MRPCAFFSPSLDPVLDRGKGHKHAVVAPEVPTRGPVGQAVFDHQPYRQINHAVGVLTAGWRQIREVGVKVLATLCPVMRRIRDHEIPWTPEVEMAQVGQRPLKLLVPIGGVTTAWTGLPLVIATIGDDLWRGQVGNRGNPFGGIGSIRTRTEHGCVLLARMLGLVLYDKGPTGAIPKPGKDAIVSIFSKKIALLSNGFSVMGPALIVAYPLPRSYANTRHIAKLFRVQKWSALVSKHTQSFGQIAYLS
jgi:hypothetical protein